MSIVTLRNGRCVGDYLRPYIVAELNTSHFGDLQIAKNMVDQAKVAGCDCVKFQSWNADSLYCESYYKKNKVAKRIVAKFSLANEELKELSYYAREKAIDFASTPYSIEEAKFLVDECEVPFIKIASMELNNLPYLTQLRSLGVPLVLSTGMGKIEEIIEAVQALSGAPLIILHCTSVYPASPEIIRLQNIIGLRSEFPFCPIGYSDHSNGVDIPAASIALGACLVEKHFTLDSSRIGMDNQMATEPEEMRAMVQACHRVHIAMGGTGRILSNEERSHIPKMRRSLVSRIKLNPGDVINNENVEFKRPGDGISPVNISFYIGKRINKYLEAGTLIRDEDIS